ncbi:hypothetical protein [Acinetobacter chinensis]|uniref:hypothetical protein n=1 Tax=Acinetobacter chinensis TaxID=2004650 RepID=UPI0029347314|nr:hypothetical protein [Acinetobacter chinensis]WOE40736.1 hypothetical protein QSG87_12690 [Acinetobacter chinensis]
MHIDNTELDKLVINENGSAMFFASYRARFSINEPVPVDVAIKSLKSFESLLERTRLLVSIAMNNINIESTEVFVTEVGEGSFIVDFLVKYVIGEENRQKAEEIYESTVRNNEKVRTVVAIGVGAALVVGAQALHSNLFPSAPQQPAIEAYNSVIINAAGDVNISPDQIKEYQSSLKDSKKLAQETVNALAPARLTPNSKIEVNGLQELTVQPEFINNVPESYQPPIPDEREEPYSNIDILIFASDKDKSETGWAGNIPSLFTKRVKFILGDDVQPAALHGTVKIKADILVKERFNKTKRKYEPYEVLILATN